MSDILFGKADILKNGAVVLGDYSVCDGYAKNKSFHFFSHIHGDHIRNFETSLLNSENLIVSTQTRELLIALKGDWLNLRWNLKPVDYKKTLAIDEDRVTLYSAKHMLGSSQILIEDREGTRILYTGDFQMPGTSIIKTDILVLDASNGAPSDIRRYDMNEPIEKLVSFVKKAVEETPVYIMSCCGKIQRVMNILYTRGVNVPFIARPEMIRIAKVYQKYNIPTGEFLRLDSEEAAEILSREQPCVAFDVGPDETYMSPKFPQIRVSQYESRSPFAERAKNRYSATLADHADYIGLMNYVRESKPKVVITDSKRHGYKAAQLAREIENLLHIRAKPKPFV